MSHSRIKLFQTSHCAFPSSRCGDSKEMMNDTRTKADRCDKYNVEWLINLTRGEGNEGKTAAGISWCESAEAKEFDWQCVNACVCGLLFFFLQTACPCVRVWVKLFLMPDPVFMNQTGSLGTHTVSKNTWVF